MAKRVGVALLVAIVAAAALWYWRWTRSPRHALRAAARAAEQHDLTTFRKYVHTEELTARFVDDLLATVAEETRGEDLGGLAAGMVMMMRPQFVRAVQDALERGIETGAFEPKESQVGNPAREAASYWRRASETQSGFRRVAYVKQDGKIAVAGLEMYDAELQQPFTVELKLRDTGSHWQVVEIANLRAVQKELEAATRKRLEVLNRPIRASLRQAVAIENGTLRNTSGRAIAEVELRGGRIHKDGLPPNGTIDVGAGAEVERIRFADGTTLQVLSTLPK
jgi:hypothetical protein